MDMLIYKRLDQLQEFCEEMETRIIALEKQLNSTEQGGE